MHLVIASVDGLCSRDLPRVRRLPTFGRFFRRGAWAPVMRGIYPTQTYPLHATMITGRFPDSHGVCSNGRPQPGVEFPPWHWFRRNVRGPTLYSEAARRGLEVASFFWPASAGAAISYNLPEIRPTRWDQNLLWMLLSGGTPLFILELLVRFGGTFRGIDTRWLDGFTAASVGHTIRSKRPHLIMCHLLDLDQARHHRGADGPHVDRILRDQDRRLGGMLEAVRSAGLADRTAFFVVGDHGHLPVNVRINLNSAFREAGDGRYFTNNCRRDAVEPTSDRFLSSHGYLPDKPGYSGVFLALGPGVRPGSRVSPMHMIDVAPTAAALLGFELPEAEGRVLSEVAGYGAHPDCGISGRY